MTLPFFKYQGTGNDFVIIDNRQSVFFKNNTKLIRHLCDRKFGIGADGLILLELDEEVDFKMVYYNADGNPSTMCGNGGRCLVAFAKALGIIEQQTTFRAVDGLHRAELLEDGRVALQMQDVTQIQETADFLFLDTGSPHHIIMVEDLAQVDVAKEGAAVRYSDRYGAVGTNVNFVSKQASDTFGVRTYERGVEDETLSCGTGVTAVALAMHYTGQVVRNSVRLHTPGGSLEVRFQKTDKGYEQVHLIGPATFVFEGVWEHQP
ncbi:diaminopimelate epimerase [Croceiramulus getboli]|nr:diaminopimelate epimerase [Flavobacteriaceae bacterium YJPT1-3]